MAPGGTCRGGPRTPLGSTWPSPDCQRLDILRRKKSAKYISGRRAWGMTVVWLGKGWGERRCMRESPNLDVPTAGHLSWAADRRDT